MMTGAGFTTNKLASLSGLLKVYSRKKISSLRATGTNGGKTLCG